MSARPTDLERASAAAESSPTIFVSDPSAEADRLSTALRASGYSVFDVPLSLLLTRVAVQRPALILLDIDAEGALETAHRVHELSGGGRIHILFLGDAGRSLGTADGALRDDRASFFVRPVEVDAVLRRVELLVSPGKVDAEGHGAGSPEASDDGPGAGASIPPAPPPPSGRLATPLPPAWTEPRDGAKKDSMSGPRAGTGHKSMPLPSLSPEIQQLLQGAEQLSSAELGPPPAAASHPSQPPSPNDEIDAVLPDEILAALDEPIDDDDEFQSESGLSTGTPHKAMSQPDGEATGRRAPSTNAEAKAISPSREPSRGATASYRPAPSDPAPASAGEVPAHAPPAGLTSPGGPVRRPRPHTSAPDTLPPAPADREAEAPASPRLPRDEATRSERDLEPVPPPSARPGSEAPNHAWDHGPLGEPGRAGRALASSAPPPSRTSRPPAADPSPPSTPQRARSRRSTSGARAATGAGAAGPRSEGPPLPPETAHDVRRGRASEQGPPTRIPEVLGPGDAIRAFALCIQQRATGALCVDAKEGVRRILLREGDVVTAASGIDRESLVGFLGTRGDLPKAIVSQVQGKIPAFGRHAGAALVANGYVGQDQLWPVLRAHAEWIVGCVLLTARGTASFEVEPPGRLKAEPSVFGGVTGCEMLVDVVQRVVVPSDALAWLGGPTSMFLEGPRWDLLEECALPEPLARFLDRSKGIPLSRVFAEDTKTLELTPVLHALSELGVLRVERPPSALRPPKADRRTSARAEHTPPPEEFDNLDAMALRSQVATRLSLVLEGDYFSLLGVARSATSYEIHRAYLDLKRALSPSRVLTAATADLADDLETVLEVLDEAHEVLRDNVRRERYRRAIEGEPPG